MNSSVVTVKDRNRKAPRTHFQNLYTSFSLKKKIKMEFVLIAEFTWYLIHKPKSRSKFHFHLKMNQMKCPGLKRGTVYILIMEGKAGNTSNNFGFREHVTILKRKLFALFPSSCLASVTHEALTLPGKHINTGCLYTTPSHGI